MNRSNSRSGAFLLEIMLAILFFSIAAALCLQMFARSSQTGKDTANLSQAIDQVRNAAELMKYAASPDTTDAGNTFFPDCLFTEYENAVVNSENTQIYFDENWDHCPMEHGIYCMEITPQQMQDSGLFCCHLAVFETDSKTPVYSLDFKLHIPNRPYLFVE